MSERDPASAGSRGLRLRGRATGGPPDTPPRFFPPTPPPARQEPTALITGCSSGFGLETARYFLLRGWTVIATMRTPKEDLLPPSDHLRILPLDVTDPDSIAQAVAAAGPFDVLVNNAGVGQVSPLEGVSMAKIRELFETNTLGVIAMTQAVLPQFRDQRSGVIVNVTSASSPCP